MKPRILLSVLTCSLAASAFACSSSDAPVSQEPATTAAAEESSITATGNIMMWPSGPIVWDGLVGTWPISIWSSAALGAVAFDMVGATGLSVSCLGFTELTPAVISPAYLGAFVPSTVGLAPGLATPYLGAAGAYAPAYGFGGAYSPFVGPDFAYGFGASAPALGSWGGTFGVGAPGLWLTPTLTSSALMFNNLAVLGSLNAYTFNVTFTAATAAQAAAISSSALLASSRIGLSIFATSILPSALVAGTAIPFTSMMYPVMMPIGIGAPILGTPIITPL